MELLPQEKTRLVKAAVGLMILASVYFVAKTITEIKGYPFVGGGSTAASQISFDGKGEVSAAPDLATVSFTVTESATDLKIAQTLATAKEKAVLDFLDKSGIAKKDIKTESYNTYPKYENVSPCYGIYCRQDSPRIIGYEVSENVLVKIHDLTKTGDIVAGIGAIKVSNMSSPNFTIEKEDALKAEARKMAIDDAKGKAESLAKDLGVHLVRIVNFSEGGNYGIPYYSKGMLAADSAGATAAPSPELPKGENKITSNVTITYEIR